MTAGAKPLSVSATGSSTLPVHDDAREAPSPKVRGPLGAVVAGTLLGMGVPVVLFGTGAASLVTRLSSDRSRRGAEHTTGVELLGVGFYVVWIA